MTARPIIGSDIGMPARVTLRREFLVHSHRQVSQHALFQHACLQPWTYLLTTDFSAVRAKRITLPVRSLARNYAQGITDSRPTVPHRCCSGTVPAYLAAVR